MTLVNRLAALLFLAIACSFRSDDDDDDFVTCGSAIKIQHKDTKYYLNSEPKNLNFGSGQQIVTFVSDTATTDTLWWLRAAHGEQCSPGEPMECDSIIRLTHLNTRRNLHSHLVDSPLGRLQEVTAYGEGDGQGDNGDNFLVKCSATKSKYWKRSEPVRLFHIDTQKYLGASKNIEFNVKTCGANCPLMGHLEAFCRPVDDQFALFVIDQGVYISK